MIALQLSILFAALVLGVESQSGPNTHKVVCNHETPVCECDSVNSAGDVDVCEFSLDIEHLQTFTRYEVDLNLNSRGVRAAVWYINRTTGEFKAYPNDRDCNVGLDDPSCTQPYTVDGRTFRSFIGVNGQIPGPTLIVYYGQTVVVHVTNRLASESTSIHWHGMHQVNTNFMDGVEHVTQCGIGPGSTFTYIFKAAPYGTTWYHSHSGAQRTDGLFGALIVKENKETSDKVKMAFRNSIDVTDFIDDPGRHTLSFLDWQRKSSIDLFTQIHSTIRFYNEEDVPMPPESDVNASTVSVDGAEVGVVTYWSGLINGKGRHPDLTYIQTRLSIFSVLPNTTYRFRLVGAQSLYAYRVSIDDHKLTVIATDGALIEPVTVDYIIVHSGERYDFLLTTKTTQELGGKSDFFIEAETLEMSPHLAEAILHYDTEGSPSADYLSIINSGLSSVPRSCTPEDLCTVLNCPFRNYPPNFNTSCLHIHELNLLLPEGTAPKAVPDDRLFFNFGFDGAGRTSAINGRNLLLPPTPPFIREPNNLCKNLDNDDTCDAGFNAIVSDECICTHIREVGTDKSVQLVLSAVGPDPTITSETNFLNAHPIHLHGHYFHVVDIQFGEYNDSDGLLIRGNEDIECGGDTVCTNPRWKSPPDDRYETENGTIRTNAPLKDTLHIPAGGYTVVYFQTDNPGFWFLHCHIEVHQLEGMAVIIQEGDGKQTLPNGFEECGNFNWTVEDFNDFINGGTVLNPSYLLILLFFTSVGVIIGT